MTETAEQLLARRRRDRAIGKKIAKRRERLADIGALVVRVDDNPDLIPELRAMIDQFRAGENVGS